MELLLYVGSCYLVVKQRHSSKWFLERDRDEGGFEIVLKTCDVTSGGSRF